MIERKKPKKAITICLILFSTLLLSITASAEIEINTTLPLEDNLVILLDYSGGTVGFREDIQAHAIHSIQNVENDSNVSIVVYGGFINNTELYRMDNQKNRSILEDFVHNITGRYGDVAYNNGDKGFEEAKKILDNSTGTKQIILISSGVISDGRHNATDKIVKKINEIRNNNVKIQLYQVSGTHLNNSSKRLYRTYKYLSDQTNTKAVILNPEEDIVFFRNETKETLPIESPSPIESPMSQMIDDGYLNEFSNDGEKSTPISTMQYDRKDFLSSSSEIHFYTYCNQTCITVPFDIGKIKFYDDKETLEDIFRNKNAIDLFKSGNITESAYTFSSSNFVCDIFDFDTFKDESKNLGGEVAPLIKRESAKLITPLKAVGVLDEFDPPIFVVSGVCLVSNHDDLLNKIAEGRIYTDNLKIGNAYNGLTREFQNYNLETIEKINERKNSYWSLIYIFNNPLYDKQLPLIKNNYAQLSQLSNQNHETEAELAIGRINDKTNESNTIMDNATYERNELNNQVPYQISEEILNFIEEPETNYTLARLSRDNADYFLNNARENHALYKFNSAIQNSKDSIAQSEEGIRLTNIEKSKQRRLKIFDFLQ